ncbi:universal stress protein UspA-like protein [Mycolicibacterium canariasense]|uniref:Universal stress protein UspA-like protein n=1 Tax=Mycolicibacterium canariasense TaxID=228230 RepID=A0A100WJC4_MYCCR|nr:universal stress protein UspA-like protein [Mycolicibacterium canariasense]
MGYLATPGGTDALALGVRLARTLGAEIELCIVLPPDRMPPALVNTGGYQQVLAGQAAEWLAEAQATVPAGVVVNPHVSFGDSFAGGLIGEAARLDAAGIVVGGGGGGLAGSFSLGSVVNELLHSSPVPVAVAPRGIRLSEVERVREVTCAVGERAGADLLLDTAVAASRAAGTPLRLVSLVALDPVFGVLRSDPDAVREHGLTHARRVLEAAKESLPQGFPVTAVVTDGPTVEDAVNKLAWRDGDLIMVGSSRLAAPRRLFLGSTAAKILRVVEVPIVVVPRSRHQEEKPQ